MTMNGDFNREVHFEIVEPIGVLASHSTGWRKEINLVRWNGGQPKYDIRDWSPDHAHMSRGITLHEKEMRHIFDLLKHRRQRDRYNRGAGAAVGGGLDAGLDTSMTGVSDAAHPEPADTASTPVPAPPPSETPPEPLQDLPEDIPAGIDDFDGMEISGNGEVL